MSESSLIMKRISKDENGSNVFLKEKEAAVWSQPQRNDFLQPGQYVACRYDQQWYVGAITQRSEIHKDVYVKFMARNKQTLSWPQDLKNEC